MASVKTGISTNPQVARPSALDDNIRKRIESYDWQQIFASMDAEGWAILPGLITAAEADSMTAIYPKEDRFRKRIVMAKHGFGRGEYSYFENPLPPLAAALRTSLYPHAAELANGWLERLGKPRQYPEKLSRYLDACHNAGQTKQTVSLLSYGADDYNCLHQDAHDDNFFPLQVVVLLDEPGKDFEGGQFMLTEQRPRQQTRGIIVEPVSKGDGIMFAANNRPVRGKSGEYQVKMRHGVNRLRSGRRHTLGVIFHDAA
jgi:hypothetical protein